MYKNFDINAPTDFEQVNDILGKCSSKRKLVHGDSKEVTAALYSLHDEIMRQLSSVKITDYSAIESFVCSLDDERHIYCIGLREREVYILEDKNFPYNADTIRLIGHINESENMELFVKFKASRWGVLTL